jgi:hypothetical protein
MTTIADRIKYQDTQTLAQHPSVVRRVENRGMIYEVRLSDAGAAILTFGGRLLIGPSSREYVESAGRVYLDTSWSVDLPLS